MSVTLPICPPDLSSRPIQFTVEREMVQRTSQKKVLK